VWQLPESLTAYDATYVALAETLGCDLLSADGRLARAPGLQCAVTVVPG
jgi:predicted nucleic acid-binding protein